MFESFGAFSAVFLGLGLVLVLLVLFEKPLAELENKRRQTRKAVISELIRIKNGQEKVIKVQDKVIELQQKNICKLKKELSTQKKINSINLETLRRERLEKSNEKK